MNYQLQLIREMCKWLKCSEYSVTAGLKVKIVLRICVRNILIISAKTFLSR
ncbi:hypothetical protein HMPREF3226_00567 [Prevotella corporis]|uniref:Uncharacterized protein n=1 Tax=Prevotella corporis TaxID=28128 RepID=A0A133QJK9_9BACT|nr:hypothetical protein HMPREF3226_00567 [Prevotella corporis]